MLEKFKQLIHPEIEIAVATLTGELIIRETATDSDISNLTVEGVPARCLAFTLDHQPKQNRACFKQLSCYLNPAEKYINKSCDCVIVTELESTWYILLLELKSEKPKRSEIEVQLKNSETFIRYLVDLLKTHYEVNPPDYKYRRVVVTTRDRSHISKSPVTPGKVQPTYRFETIPLKPKNGNAKVHLGKLLRPLKL